MAEKKLIYFGAALFIVAGLLLFSFYKPAITGVSIDNGALIQSVDSCEVLNTSGATYIQNANIIPSGVNVCINITAQNIVFDGNGFSIINSAFNKTAIYSNKINTTIKNVNVIINNTVPTQTGGIGIQFTGSNNSLIDNSTIIASTGIYFTSAASGSNIVRNSTISTRAVNGYGIYLLSSSKNQLTNNNITTTGTTAYGTYISGSSSNILSGNTYNVTIADTIRLLTATSINNTLTNNVITDNKRLQLNFATAGINRTYLINQPIRNYSFAGTGGTVIFQNTQFGLISFLNVISGTGTNLSSDVELDNNSVSINSSKSGLNKTANITLYNLPTTFVNPKILRDGINCPQQVCQNFTGLNSGNVSFNVTSWFNNYSIGENSPDVTAPAINFTSPTLPSGYGTGKSEVYINVSSSDNVGLGAITIYFYDSGNNLFYTNSTTASRLFVNISNLSAGTYFYNATSNDTSGNIGYTETRNITLELTGTNFSVCRYLDTPNAIYTQMADIIPLGTSTSACLNITAENVTLNGNGFSIINRTYSGSAIFSNKFNTTIKNINISIKNTAATQTGGIGVRLLNSNRSSVKNSFINASTAVYLTSSDYGLFESNIILTNASSGYGVYLESSSNGIIRDNIIRTLTNDGVGIYLWSNANDNLITNNTITTRGQYAYAITIDTNSNRNVMSYNTLNTTGYLAIVIYITNADYNNATDNIIYASGSYGTGILTYAGAANNLLRDNTITTYGNNGYGIVLQNSNNNDVINNTADTYGSTQAYAFGEFGESSSEVSNNTFTTHGTTNWNIGAYLDSSTGGTFIGNTIASSGYQGYGIYSTATNGMTLSDNNITTSGSNSPGLYLYTNANNLTILDNIIATGGSNSPGLSTSGASNNTIGSNNITNTGAGSFNSGMYFIGGTNNVISNNSINSTNSPAFTLSNTVNNNITGNTVIPNGQLDFSISGTGQNNIAQDQINVYSFVNAGITRSNDFGTIRFLSGITQAGTNISADIQILDNLAYVNSSKAGLNKSANITLYNVPTTFTNPAILKDSIYVCNQTTSPFCYNFTSLNAGTVSFNVSSWSTYSIGENPGTTAASTPVSQSSSAGGGGGCLTIWICSDWSSCINDKQTRLCSKEKQACYVKEAKPSENQSCTELVNEIPAPASNETIATPVIPVSINKPASINSWIIAIPVLAILAIVLYIFFRKILNSKKSKIKSQGKKNSRKAK